MSIHGFITATTTANQSILINVDEIVAVVANVTDRYCKIKTTDGEVYPVFLSTHEVAEKIEKAQLVSASYIQANQSVRPISSVPPKLRK